MVDLGFGEVGYGYHGEGEEFGNGDCEPQACVAEDVGEEEKSGYHEDDAAQQHVDDGAQ